MKFKQDAVVRAVYKLLAIIVGILYLQAAVLFVMALFFVAIRDNQSAVIGIVYLVSSIVIAGLGEYIRNIRTEMVDK